MKVSVADFLGNSYNHGDLITILNNKELNDVLFQAKYETIDNFIANSIANLEVVKWGIEKNGIVIYVNYEKGK